MKAREILTVIRARVNRLWTKLQETEREAVQSKFGPPLFLLVGFLLSTLFLETFFKLAEEIFRSALTNRDTAVFYWFQGARSAPADHISRLLTRLGNTPTLIAVVSCVTISLVVWRRHSVPHVVAV